MDPVEAKLLEIGPNSGTSLDQGWIESKIRKMDLLPEDAEEVFTDTLRKELTGAVGNAEILKLKPLFRSRMLSPG